MYIFELNKKQGLWYWRLKNTRGRGSILAKSNQGYNDRSNAQRSANQARNVLKKEKIPFVSIKK